MKALVTIFALAALASSSAVAKTAVGTKHSSPPKPIAPAISAKPADRGNMFESDSLGRQWFPNPDRQLPVPDHYP
jgi:hypothetical protein